jgi:pimeloyl-ACP methyl ester carboxylesterase
MRLTGEIDPPYVEGWTRPPAAPRPHPDLLDRQGTRVPRLARSPLVYPDSEGRLSRELRDLARRADPFDNLVRAAVEFCRAPTSTVATAMADLAVTGQRAYERFAAHPVAESALVAAVSSAFDGSAVDIDDAVRTTLDRVYSVAWALRCPDPEVRARLRPALGWIAVSGEDDAPGRPVNAASLPHEQFDIDVACGDHVIRTRGVIALPESRRTELPEPPFRTLPLPREPVIPSGHDVILFLHGHSSCCEEAADLIGSLLAETTARGRRVAVVAFDLPSNGYSAMIDHTDIAPPATTKFDPLPFGRSHATCPLLDFLDEFVIAFIDALDARTPVKDRIAAVIGGSLGGNLGLRLAEHGDISWLSAVVSWSPASVWTTFNHDLVKGIALRAVQGRMVEEERDETRANFFRQSYDSPVGPGQRTQPEHWYRDGWDGAAELIESGRWARREVYNREFRRWHWRVALEQLLFSHHNTDTPDRAPRYESNSTPTLLAAGAADNFPFSRIYSATRRLAVLMTHTPGTTLFVKDTGHSIHNERPGLLATQIADFLWGSI